MLITQHSVGTICCMNLSQQAMNKKCVDLVSFISLGTFNPVPLSPPRAPFSSMKKIYISRKRKTEIRLITQHSVRSIYCMNLSRQVMNKNCVG